MVVLVVDYGIGNVGSVVNACRLQDIEVEIATSGEEIEKSNASHIVLPGVGASGAALASIQERGIGVALRRRVLEEGVPYLGICVGMQILSDECREFGTHKGFGWLSGVTEQLAPGCPKLKVPHVGWNEIEVNSDTSLLKGLAGEHFYFTHSFAFRCFNDDDVIATTEYGSRFVSAVRKRNIFGVQFHPEKSSAAGSTLIANFLNLQEC